MADPLRTAAIQLSANGIAEAASRIRPFLPPTPLLALSTPEDASPPLLLKMENRQPTGAFKVRGAFNRLLSLTEEERQAGVIAASTGNHGAAVAHAGAALGIPVTVYMPESVSSKKLARLETFGVEIHLVPGDAVLSESTARDAAESSGRIYVSPYNDPRIVSGQGSAAVEILEQCPDLETIYVAVGGGGLAGGIGLYLKERAPHVHIVGCQPAASPVMSASVTAGRVVELEEETTLSDGTAGGLEPDAITLKICCSVIDEWRLVSEEAIRDAIRWMHWQSGEIIEGAAGVALATCLAQRRREKSVVVICGGNIDDEVVRGIIV